MFDVLFSELQQKYSCAKTLGMGEMGNTGS
jgi:hypothetical protein